ncbi:MAG: SPASM domain-containing protein [Atribacterota bacterium]|nr:SPASM domain-containing protein [Atribacterota bacterium]
MDEKIIISLKNNLPNKLTNFLKKLYHKVKWAAYRIRWLIRYRHADFFNDLDIEINTNCNRRCSYCPNSVSERSSKKNEKLMPEETYRKIINELADINFNGRISPSLYGEPLLEKRLNKFIKYTRKKLPKVKIVILTNGDYLTIDIFKELIESGTNEFMVTQHDEKVASNIVELFEYIKKYRKYRKFVKYNHFTSETPLCNRGGLVKPKVQNKTPRCATPDNPVVIDYAGNVLLCCNDYHSLIKFGNINNQKLLEIWFGEQYKKMRRDIRKGIFELPICKKCLGLIQ